MPPKPGLVRDRGFRGPGIEVEVWAVPEAPVRQLRRRRAARRSESATPSWTTAKP